MARRTEEKYSCDNCGKNLPTYSNHVVIETPKRGYDVDGGQFWQRLRVEIINHEGVHNAARGTWADDRVAQADLCQRCAVKLLEDALKRVKAGERLSAGVETIEMLKFNQPF